MNVISLYWIPHYKFEFCWLHLTSGIFECDLQGDQCHKSHWRWQPPDRELSHYDLIDYNDKNGQLQNHIILATDPCICCAVSTRVYLYAFSSMALNSFFGCNADVIYRNMSYCCNIYRCDFGVKSCMKSMSVPSPFYYMKPYTDKLRSIIPKSLFPSKPYKNLFCPSVKSENLMSPQNTSANLVKTIKRRSPWPGSNCSCYHSALGSSEDHGKLAKLICVI